MFDLKLFLQVPKIGKQLYYLFFVLSGVAVLPATVFAAVNFKAGHMRTGTVSLFTAILMFVAFFLLRNSTVFVYSTVIFCATAAAAVLIFRYPEEKNDISSGGNTRFDERDISFVRYELVPGTDCGKCLAVCPMGHTWDPFKILALRYALAGRLLKWLDDVFYGRKPSAKPLLKWMVKGK